MPHGRRLRVVTMRLRAAAASGDAAGGRGRAGRDCIYASGRARDRVGPENQGLQVAGARTGHRGGEPETWVQDGFARVRFGSANPRRPRLEDDSAAYE